MELELYPHDLIPLADLVPVPLSEPIAVRQRLSGELRLLWAVLADGIECYLRSGAHPSAGRRKLFQEAKAWIESTEGEELCSFMGLCGALEIDPSYLRRGLRRRLPAIRRSCQLSGHKRCFRLVGVERCHEAPHLLSQEPNVVRKLTAPFTRTSRIEGFPSKHFASSPPSSLQGSPTGLIRSLCVQWDV
jgi:hypothetical protein